LSLHDALPIYLDLDLRGHLGGGHQPRWTILGRRRQAGGSVGVERGREDSAPALASPHRHYPGALLQPGWTTPGQRESGWPGQAVGHGEWHSVWGTGRARRGAWEALTLPPV